MGAYASVYVVDDTTEYGKWIRSLWFATLSSDDVLSELDDQIGEATVWGEWPHWSVTEALTVTDMASKTASGNVW